MRISKIISVIVILTMTNLLQAKSFVCKASENSINDITITHLVPKPIRAIFVGIMVVKSDPVTGDIIETWETINYCAYTVNSSRSRLSFEEKTPEGKMVKSWSYKIRSYTEDSTAFDFLCEGEGGTIDIIIWKDLHMVAMEGIDATILVTGYQTSAKPQE